MLIWGDGTGSTQVVNGVASGKRVNQFIAPIYGRIANGQLGTVGVYTDTITVSVIW